MDKDRRLFISLIEEQNSLLSPGDIFTESR